MSRIVDCFDDACKKYRERTAFIDIQGEKVKKVSFDELKTDVDRVCDRLVERGMKQKEKVVLFVSPSYELLVFMLACLKLGVSLMIIDIWAGKHLIRKTLEEYQAEYIAVSGKTKLLRLAFREFRKIKDAILIDKVFEAEQIENMGKTQEKPQISKVSGNEVAVLTMTTGSTGRPKIILRSHEDLYNQLELVRSNMEERKEETVALNTSFMYHFVNILNGYSGILLHSKKPKLLRMFPKKRQVQRLPAQVLFTSPDFCMKTEILFPKLEELYFGGAILNLYEAEKIRKKFPDAKITYIYGATECNLICKTDLDDYINSLKEGQTVLGEAVKGVCIKTDDKQEIMVHSDVVLTDYLNPENKRGEVDEEGRYWHKTGDLGRIEDGKLYYLGRRDVFVKGKDRKLFSNDLEQEIVRSFSGIRKCAFFYHNGNNYLFIEGDFPKEEVLRDFVKEREIGEDVIITCLPKIPCDAKHNSKINYNQLKQMAEKKRLKGKARKKS